MTSKAHNAREELEAAAHWLGWQNETLSFGLASAEDGLRLWRYAKDHRDLDEFADNWTTEQRKAALGYCPFEREGVA